MTIFDHIAYRSHDQEYHKHFSSASNINTYKSIDNENMNITIYNSIIRFWKKFGHHIAKACSTVWGGVTYRLKSQKLRLSCLPKDYLHVTSIIQHKVWRFIVISIDFHPEITSILHRFLTVFLTHISFKCLKLFGWIQPIPNIGLSNLLCSFLAVWLARWSSPGLDFDLVWSNTFL